MKPKGGRVIESQTRILVIEDDKCFVDALKITLKESKVKIDWAKSSEDAFSFLKDHSPYAVTIIDQHLPRIKGDELALVIRKQYPELQIIFATGDLTQETLTELLKTGIAVGFIPKGSSREALLNPISKAIRSFEHERRILSGETTPPLEAERKLMAAGIIGRSTALLDILKRADNFRRLPAPALILGESGTGKEVIAQSFVKGFSELLPVNCSTFIGREHLMESELFGVVKGAFTGVDLSSDYNLFNARRDSLQSKKTWKPLFGEKHALFPFLKFYEWVESKSGIKQELSFSPDNFQSMWASSLFEEFKSPHGSVFSFAMVTDEPPPEVAAAGHDRCPVFLEEQYIERWLHPAKLSIKELDGLLEHKQQTYFSHQRAA